MNNPTDEQLSRAVAEKLNKWDVNRDSRFDGVTLELTPQFSTDWQLIGPEIEKRKIDCVYIRGKWIARITGTTACGQDETLPRAACLAILEE